MSISRRIAREEGTFLILFGLLLVALVAMVAIVIDLAQLRQDRGADRSIADAAATAAVTNFGVTSSAAAACEHAWQYFLTNTTDEGTVTKDAILTAPNRCADLPAACDATTGEAFARGIAGDYTVTITYPVPDTSDLMTDPDAIGSPTQAIHDRDGDQCDRIGVTVHRARDAWFAGVIGWDAGSTTSHSVALYRKVPGSTKVIPALVALEPTNCEVINANTGIIHAFQTSVGPAYIYADSRGTGPGCGDGQNPQSQNQKVMTVQNCSQGQIIADTGPDGSPGELGVLPALTRGFKQYCTGSSYVGLKVRLPGPITREPVDDVYHCGNHPDGCDGDPDPIQDLEDTLLDPIPDFSPETFSTYENDPATPEDECATLPSSFATGNWFINCPTVTVDSGGTNLIKFGGGKIVFAGDLHIQNGLLLINASETSPGSGVAAVDANGYPIPDSPTLDSTLVIRGSTGITTQSSTSKIAIAQTFVYSQAAFDMQGGPEIRWTPPEAGGFADLLYWSEAAVTNAIAGTPIYRSVGIIFTPNARLEIQGTGLVDAREVQYWTDTVAVTGTSEFRLRPNPNKSIKLDQIRSELIR